MTDGILYAFEALTEDLPRPPLVAMRALLSAGIVPAPRGWLSLDIPTRIKLARLGLASVIDVEAVLDFAQRIPPRHMKLVSPTHDPDPDDPPICVVNALGPSRPISAAEWHMLRAVDRAVLANLSANTRLIARAYDELAESMGKAPDAHKHWSGKIARCELHLKDAAIERIMSNDFLDGRAMMLARVAGIRAARRTNETLVAHVETAAGMVELDGIIQYEKGRILWQAHVSSWDGTFFPAAALLASTTAAAALMDMVRDADPEAHIEAVEIREESWMARESDTKEEVTRLYPSSLQVIQRLDAEAKTSRKSKGSMPQSVGSQRLSNANGKTASTDAIRTAGDVVPNSAQSRGIPQAAEPCAESSARSPITDHLGSSVQQGAMPNFNIGPPSSSSLTIQSAKLHPFQYQPQYIVAAPQRMPPGLLALLVSSLLIFGLAMGVLGYLMAQSI